MYHPQVNWNFYNIPIYNGNDTIWVTGKLLALETFAKRPNDINNTASSKIKLFIYIARLGCSMYYNLFIIYYKPYKLMDMFKTSQLIVSAVT